MHNTLQNDQFVGDMADEVSMRDLLATVANMREAIAADDMTCLSGRTWDEGGDDEDGIDLFAMGQTLINLFSAPSLSPSQASEGACVVSEYLIDIKDDVVVVRVEAASAVLLVVNPRGHPRQLIRCQHAALMEYLLGVDPVLLTPWNQPVACHTIMFAGLAAEQLARAAGLQFDAKAGSGAGGNWPIQQSRWRPPVAVHDRPRC